MALAIEEGLRAYLLADATVSGLIGTRFTPLAEAQRQARPYAVYQRISTEIIRSLKANSGLRWARVQVDCYGDTYASAKAVAHAISERIDSDITPGTFGTYCVPSCRILDEWDGYEEPERDGERGIYRTSLDVKVWFEEQS